MTSVPQAEGLDVRTDLVRLSDELAEAALSGDCEKAMLITLATCGRIDMNVVGLTNFEVLGVLQMTQISLNRKMLTGE